MTSLDIEYHNFIFTITNKTLGIKYNTLTIPVNNNPIKGSLVTWRFLFCGAILGNFASVVITTAVAE